ncbi:MAG: Pyrroline-5-carboxylate reductase [Devosia sp.]|nr:Pyrroline-5-carboxylate reductase [Devosia sp.]
MTLASIGSVVLVGAGKMGIAMARGWLDAGLVPGQLVLVDPNPSEATTEFAREHGVQLIASTEGTAPSVLVLAVKPLVIGPVLAAVQSALGPDTLVISIAAGISLATLTAGLGTGRLIRTMPNTPAQVGKGVTGVVPGPRATDGDRDVVEALLSANGTVVFFETEAQLDAVTAVSGSGPAYVFNLVEAMAAAGVRQGLTQAQAMLLARETVIGAAALMEADPSPAAVLRQNVTSPNGTTAAALAVLMADDGLGPLLDRAVDAARRRSEELGRG